MKKIVLSLIVVFAFAFGANAQACTKSAGSPACCAKKAASSAAVKTDMSAADLAAESDASIQKRVCPESGNVTYYQKSNENGKVNWAEVKFDESAKSFTRVASASMEKDVETGEVKKAECSKDAKAACCSKDKAKACCADKKKSN